MKLELYQWLVPILAGFYIIRTIKQYTSGKYSPRNTIIWITFWVAISAALNRVENQLTDLIRQLALSQALIPTTTEETINIKSSKPITKNTTTNKSKNNTTPIIENIEELENIVNKLRDTNSELPENIPNEGKTPKSKSKK